MAGGKETPRQKMIGMMYLVLTALLAGLPRRWVLGVLALHAPVSEVVQATLLSSRDGDVWDAVADLTGIGLALGAFLVIVRMRRW